MKKFLQKSINLPVWAVLLFAICTRLIGLFDSFWLDEAAQALESTRPLSQQLHIAEDFQPPLLHLIVHFAAQISHAEAWLRLWGALIPGILSIYCSYKIAETLFSRRIAVTTALLLSTASFHIFYSQELRPYALSAALATLSWLVLVQSFFIDKKFTLRTMAGYAVATTLGLYSTYLYPFVILSQVCYVVWKERAQILQYCISTTVGGLLFLPWIPSLLEQLAVGQALRKSLPGWEAVVSIPQLKSLPLTLGKFMFGVLNIDINPTFIVITAAFIIGMFWTIIILWQHDRVFLKSKQFILIMCWLFVPLITSWLVSFSIPVVQPKRVLYLLPAFYIFILAAVLQLQSPNKKQPIPLRVQYTIVALTSWVLIALNTWSLIAYITNPLYQRENWRGLHQQIVTEYPTDSAVVFGFDAAFAPWRWYDEESYPVFATGSLVTTPQAAVAEKLKKASDYRYILVFDYLRDLTDPDRKIEAALENLGYSEKKVFGMPGIGFVRVYARQKDVLT